MLKLIKKYKPYLISAVLLLPAHVATMFFVYLFTSVTGKLMFGYVLGCILFGFLASLPILKHTCRGSGASRIIRGMLTVFVMAGIIFLTMLSVNTT